MQKNTIKGFVYHKVEERYTSCQDRLFCDTTKNFFAVSDGVSSSFSPGYYAKMITQYQDGSDSVRIDTNDAKVIGDRWRNHFQELLDCGKLGKNSTVRFKRGDEPSATYVRLAFDKNKNWRAVVLGDCTLIHLRKTTDGFDIMHVMSSGAKYQENGFNYVEGYKYYNFDDAPDQLTFAGDFLQNQSIFEDALKEGDMFLMLTDGISKWVLYDPKKTQQRLSILINDINCQFSFKKLVEDEVNHNRMSNDDSTMLFVGINDLSDAALQIPQTLVADLDTMMDLEKQGDIDSLAKYEKSTAMIIETDTKSGDVNTENNNKKLSVGTPIVALLIAVLVCQIIIMVAIFAHSPQIDRLEAGLKKNTQTIGQFGNDLKKDITKQDIVLDYVKTQKIDIKFYEFVTNFAKRLDLSDNDLLSSEWCKLTLNEKFKCIFNTTDSTQRSDSVYMANLEKCKIDYRNELAKLLIVQQGELETEPTNKQE